MAIQSSIVKYAEIPYVRLHGGISNPSSTTELSWLQVQNLVVFDKNINYIYNYTIISHKKTGFFTFDF